MTWMLGKVPKTPFFLAEIESERADAASRQASRRAWLNRAVKLAAASVIPARAQARETPLPTPASLPAAAALAQAAGEPLVLLVSLPGCPFCELIRRNYLAPMRAADGLHAWQIQVNDSQTPLQDFAVAGGSRIGTQASASAFATRTKARFTPTVLFLNGHGLEVAERIEGVASADFFGAVLEARLSTARLGIAQAAHIARPPPTHLPR